MSSTSTRMQKTEPSQPSWRITWSDQLNLGQVVVLRKNVRNRLSMNPVYATLPIGLAIKQGSANGLYFAGPKAFADLVLDYLKQSADNFKYANARFTLEEDSGNTSPEPLAQADLDTLLEAAEKEIRAQVHQEWSGSYDAEVRKREGIELELKGVTQERNKYADELSQAREESTQAETRYKSTIAAKERQLADAMKSVASATAQAVTLERTLELSMLSAPVSDLSIHQYLTVHDRPTQEILDAALRLKEAGVDISHYVGRQMDPSEAALKEVYAQCQPLIGREYADTTAVIAASRKELQADAERQRKKTEAQTLLGKLQHTIDTSDADVKTMVEASLKAQMDTLRVAANPAPCNTALCEIARNYDRCLSLHIERARVYQAHKADIIKAVTPIPFIILEREDGVYHYAPESVCTAVGIHAEEGKPLSGNLLYIMPHKSAEAPAVVKQFMDTFGFSMLWNVNHLEATVTYGMPAASTTETVKTEPTA